MMEWYKKLNICFKTVFWTIIITLTLLITLIPLFFLSLSDIPLGILVGGIFGSLYYLGAGFNQRDRYIKSALTIDVILLITRFVLFASALVGLALMYYVADIHIFNIFGFVGAYLISLLMYLFLSGKEGKK